MRHLKRIWFSLARGSFSAETVRKGRPMEPGFLKAIVSAFYPSPVSLIISMWAKVGKELSELAIKSKLLSLDGTPPTPPPTPLLLREWGWQDVSSNPSRPCYMCDASGTALWPLKPMLPTLLTKVEITAVLLRRFSAILQSLSAPSV